MFGPVLSGNLLSWMLQTLVIAISAALLPIVLRVRYPRVQLVYCQVVLALCILLPILQPWRSASSAAMTPPPRWLLAVVAAGVAIQLCWMLGGLWRIRRYRIAAAPLYPIPEAMQAASEITRANAVFCVSEDATGPMMMGWLAPVVLLPASFLKMDEEAQCGIACHELLHVRRGDWLVTLIEELSGSLLWFNPGVWLLLSEARLAREQLVDAESVRLTASRDSYIDALLAMARGEALYDLAPAPRFLRRSHLTQRMQALLSDAPPSALRLVGSYCSIAVILACSAWFACSSFPMLAQPGAIAASSQPVAPTPRETPPPVVQAPLAAVREAPRAETLSTPVFVDPYEPVTGGVQLASTPEDRASALLLLEGARKHGLKHAPGTPPYRFNVSFLSTGNVLDTGQGELSETWMTGQKWRWTVNLGAVAHTRLLFRGQQLEDRHVAVIPMRSHMVRNEIFWAIGGFTREARIRTARIQWQGKPATCILRSAGTAEAPQGRAWDEEEYCIDDESGVLVVHSVAPGTYARFGYDAIIQFHDCRMPYRITIYVAGALAADASFSITDTSVVDEESLTPTPEMTATQRPVGLGIPFKAILLSRGVPAASAQPVIVHAEIDGDGAVVESELSAAANLTLVPAALDRVTRMNFGHTGTERQAYVDVRLSSASQ